MTNNSVDQRAIEQRTQEERTQRWLDSMRERTAQQEAREAEAARAEGRSPRTAQERTAQRQEEVSIREAEIQAEQIQRTGRVEPVAVIREPGETVEQARLRSAQQTLQRVADQQSQLRSERVVVTGEVQETRTPDPDRSQRVMDLLRSSGAGLPAETLDVDSLPRGPGTEVDFRRTTPIVDFFARQRSSLEVRREMRAQERWRGGALTTVRTLGQDFLEGLGSGVLGVGEFGARTVRGLESPERIGSAIVSATNIPIEPGRVVLGATARALESPGRVGSAIVSAATSTLETTRRVAGATARGLESFGDRLGEGFDMGGLPAFQAAEVIGGVGGTTIPLRVGARIGRRARTETLTQRIREGTATQKDLSTQLRVQIVDRVLLLGWQTKKGGVGLALPITRTQGVTGKQLQEALKTQSPLTELVGRREVTRRTGVSRRTDRDIVRRGDDFLGETTISTPARIVTPTADVPFMPTLRRLSPVDSPRVVAGNLLVRQLQAPRLDFIPTTATVRARFDQGLLGRDRFLPRSEQRPLFPRQPAAILESPLAQALRSTFFVTIRRPTTTPLRGRVFRVRDVVSPVSDVATGAVGVGAGTALATPTMAQATLVTPTVVAQQEALATPTMTMAEISQVLGGRQRTRFETFLAEQQARPSFSETQFQELFRGGVISPPLGTQDILRSTPSMIRERSLTGFVEVSAVGESFLDSTSFATDTSLDLASAQLSAQATSFGDLTIPALSTDIASLTMTGTGLATDSISITDLGLDTSSLFMPGSALGRTGGRGRRPGRSRRLFDPDDDDDEEDLRNLFLAQVRRRGRFLTIGAFETPQQAFGAARTKVRETAAASLRVLVEDTREPVVTGALLDPRVFEASPREEGVFIEKPEFRIDSPGELREITREGQRALRRQRRS